MNSCYLCHLHSYVFSLFSDSSASLYYLIRLIWRVYQMSENRGRVEGRTFVVFNESLPMVWRSLCLPVRPEQRSGPLRKGRCSRYGSALSLRNICWELTHLF